VVAKALVATAALAASLACRGTPPAPQPPARLNDSEAGRVVLRAIEAHGGWEAWMRARSAEYEWEHPGKDPNGPWDKARVKLDLHGGRVRIEQGSTGWVHVWDGREAWSDPADIPEDIPARFLTRTEHYWFGLPWKLADEGVRLELLEDEERGGRRFRRVRAAYAEGAGDTPQDWYIYYFDADTGLLGHAVFIVSYFGLEPGQTDFAPAYGEWSEYGEAGGLRIARLRRFASWNDGKPDAFSYQDRLLDVRVSPQPLPEEIFQRPGSGESSGKGAAGTKGNAGSAPARSSG
jgi:hypothetical protein